MNTKLTLRMDESLIAAAKDYAAAHGSSLSQMVANYFAALAQRTKSGNPHPALDAEDAQLQEESGPITRRLVGILQAQPGQPQVCEDDYHAYLERKYLGNDAQRPSESSN